jgi:hypothetical protein
MTGDQLKDREHGRDGEGALDFLRNEVETQYDQG